MPRAAGQKEGGSKKMGTSQRQMEKEGTQEQKKKLIVAVWEREQARGGTGMQKRGDRAPRAQDSPQLSLSVLPGDFDTSDASLSFSLPFFFCNSNRLALLHLRVNACGCLITHTTCSLLDNKPHTHTTCRNRTEKKRM